MRKLQVSLTPYQEYTNPRLRWRTNPVTVCVAAIFEGASILGASDRMLTARDIQFQPNQSKIWDITNSIVSLVAGDVGLHAEIYQRVARILTARISANPKEWLKVDEVVALYAEVYQQIRLQYAEREVLFPLGLNQDSFLKRQKELSNTFINEITTKLLRFRIPEVGVIIAGIDGPPATPHLYVVEDGQISCATPVGFAAIGAGYWHANSQFMFDGHTRNTHAARALRTVFWAKKRAEIAPGVGTETDMVTLGPALGSATIVRADVVEDMEKIYKRCNKGLENHNKRTVALVEDYVKQLATKQAPQQQSPPPQGPSSTPENTS